ncbi:MAG: hypothetical protein IPJ34_18480 [Myxococcales bacterium]|nr:hypothetical protein [Myxococcales bacterium]
MFAFAYEPLSGTAVFHFSGSSKTDADFERYLAAVDQLDTLAGGRADAAVVTVVEHGNPPPNAKWRQRIAERSRTLHTQAIAVLVSTSPLIRGVMTVLNWLAPQRFREQTVASTFEEAVEWVERRLPHRGVVLRQLLDEARAKSR